MAKQPTPTTNPIQALIDAGSGATDPYAAATDTSTPGVPTIPAGRDTSKPIGVAPGYNPTFLMPGQADVAQYVPGFAQVPNIFQGTVNYFKGDEYYQLPHGADLATLQQQLVSLGMLNPTGIQYGSVDTKTVAAFAHLLADSNAAGVAWSDMLQTKIAIAKGGGQGVSARTRAPLIVRVTDPDALKQTFQKVAQTLYGGNLPDDVVNNLVTTYQSMESNYQTQAYQAAGYNPLTGQTDVTQTPEAAGATPIVVKQPDPSAFAEAQIRHNYPNQVAATEFGNAMNDILNTFTAGAPGATAAKG